MGSGSLAAVSVEALVEALPAARTAVVRRAAPRAAAARARYRIEESLPQMRTTWAGRYLWVTYLGKGSFLDRPPRPRHDDGAASSAEAAPSGVVRLSRRSRRS